MNPQHTAGDWEVFADNGTHFVYAPGSKVEQITDEKTGEKRAYRDKLIALVYSCDAPGKGGEGVTMNQEANARLVAASPKMLEALNEAAKYLLARNLGEPARELADKICAVIAQAEGTK